MLEQQRREQAQSPEPYQDKSTHLNIDTDTTGDRNGGEVPATVKINFGLEPTAYRYESWSEMADGWTESVRSTAAAMPDPDHEQVRNVTPLVPLADVEALVERLVMSGEVALPHQRTTVVGDISLR